MSQALFPLEWSVSESRPIVHLIWEIEVGSEVANLVYIASTRERATRVLELLNNKAKYEERLIRYTLEEKVPIDHLFAANRYGLVDTQDEVIKITFQDYFAVVRHHEAEIQKVKDQAAEKFKKYESEILQLKCTLALRY